MYQQQQVPPSNTYRLRPVPANRPAKQQQRRSVAVTTDLHRYYTPPVSAVYLPQTLPVNTPFHAPSSTVSGSTTINRGVSRQKLNQLLSSQNVPGRIQPAPFPTISVEVRKREPSTGTRREHPKHMIEADSSSASNATSHFLKWLRKQPPRSASKPPPNNRSNWTSSLPRNFSIRMAPNAPPQRPVVQKLKTKPSNKQPPRPARVNFSDVDGHYDNAPTVSSGYYNVTLSPPSKLTPSQAESASKYATIGRRSLPRYNQATTNARTKTTFNTLPKKMAPPPPEPAPDYSSDSRSNDSSVSPIPAPRVRFNLDQKPKPRQSVPIPDRSEQMLRPRGLIARAFERNIYKKLRPLIQIRGIKVDEKEIGRRRPTHPNTRSVSPPPQRSILLNGRKEPDQPATLTRTKRPAPLPPVIKNEGDVQRLSSPYDNSSSHHNLDILSSNSQRNGTGVCYVEGNRIEYRLEWGGNQLLVHYESRNLNDEIRNTADAEIIADLLNENDEQAKGLLSVQTPMAILPQRGTITDMEYGPGLVKRLREKFTQMAKQSSSSAALTTTSYKRFSSLENVSSSECSDAQISQTLPRMKVSKSANENLSSTTTGYSSEESSSQTSEHNRPSNNMAEYEYQTHTYQPNKMNSTISRIIIMDEVENTAPRVPIRSLREKFENQTREDRVGGKNATYPRSSSAHTVAKYNTLPHKPSAPSKSPAFSHSFSYNGNTPHVSEYSNQNLPKESSSSSSKTGTVIQNVIINRPISPALSSSSSDVFEQPGEPIHEISDDLESISSNQEERWGDRQLVHSSIRSSPFKTQSSLMFQIPSSSSSTAENKQQSVAVEGINKRVTFNLPLDKPVLRTNREGILIGRPGSTPVNEEAPGKISALKDATGMFEVHQLLNKFNTKRLAEQRQEEESNLLVRARKTYDSPLGAINSAEKPPIPRQTNENSIHPTTITFNGQTASNNPTPQRKSLSARYLESKQQQNSTACPPSHNFQQDSLIEQNTLSENITPSIDCVESIHDDENTSISSMDSLDIVEEIVGCQPFETMFAAECGPVRQSLLNLVLQDDIPDLLIAMSEDLHFVFDDYLPMQAPTGIIVNGGSRRRANGQKHTKTNRICFADASPSVFTYLDESSALEEGQWREGRHINYDEYLKLVRSIQDQAARQAIELSKWRGALQMKFVNKEDSTLNAAASELAQASLQPSAASPSSSSRTPTPDEIDRFGSLPSRYPFSAPSSTRSTTLIRRECGTSAI